MMPFDATVLHLEFTIEPRAAEVQTAAAAPPYPAAHDIASLLHLWALLPLQQLLQRPKHTEEGSPRKC
jgi:hypothetical protein